MCLCVFVCVCVCVCLCLCECLYVILYWDLGNASRDVSHFKHIPSPVSVTFLTCHSYATEAFVLAPDWKSCDRYNVNAHIRQRNGNEG